MEKKFTRRWDHRGFTIRVVNMACGRVDVHRNISKEEISWIASNPNLKIEVLDEVKFYKNKND